MLESLINVQGAIVKVKEQREQEEQQREARELKKEQERIKRERKTEEQRRREEERQQLRQKARDQKPEHPTLGSSKPLLKKVGMGTAAVVLIAGVIFAINIYQERKRYKNPTAKRGYTSQRTTNSASPVTQAKEIRSKTTNIEMVLIPAGEFVMGSTKYNNEEPVHKVYIDTFYIDKNEITNAEYEKFDPSHKSKRDKYSDGDNDPVVYVSWWDAIKYCNWRSQKEGLESCYKESTGECDFTNNGYRLPTEAEWEKAARGTDGRKYPWGNSEPNGRQCNFADKNTDYYWSDRNVNDGYECTSPVGKYEAGKSPYGLYDMAGNVYEWCNDWYDKGYYEDSPHRNPKGPGTGKYRVLRGGSWSYYPVNLRAAYRIRLTPDYRYSDYGFRCACRV